MINNKDTKNSIHSVPPICFFNIGKLNIDFQAVSKFKINLNFNVLYCTMGMAASSKNAKLICACVFVKTISCVYFHIKSHNEVGH